MNGLDRLEDWLRGSALPLWFGTGFDATGGTFQERLDMAGAAQASVARRVMVQGRQIYVAHCAARWGWHDQAAPLACAAGEAMLARYQADGAGGWAFQCDDAGAIVDGHRDLYAQAFVLLSLGSLAALTGEMRYLEAADRTLAFLDAEMAGEEGGYVEAWPATVLPRRQNPHMHLFEALLHLHQVDSSRGYLARADALFALFEGRFVDAEHGILHEHFENDWRPRNDSLAFEPGHHFEWVWLLEQYDMLSGADNSVIAARLMEAGLLGVGDDGLIQDSYALRAPASSGSSRLWPHTEAVKAASTKVGRAFDPQGIERNLIVLQKHFLDRTVVGGWADRVDSRGRVTSKFMPASSLYHLCCAVNHLCQVREAAGAHRLETKKVRMDNNHGDLSEA